MGRAYLPAFGFLFAVGFLEWLIPSEFTKMSSLIQLAIGIACAIAAKPLTEAQIVRGRLASGNGWRNRDVPVPCLRWNYACGSGAVQGSRCW